ncbi:jg19033 [Pararge aegeria aegeria]|uniref:Jg19033 protein n=1 Tax=Pararge aegeria aegeria TaxID=348720 RepID=A0A8S4R3Q2_9NEOP|nr:jg19033 [Pararge aegeria aegeria]
MSVLIRHYKPGGIYNTKIWRFASTTAESTKQTNGEDEEEFRVLDILKKKDRFQRKVARKTEVPPDRTDKMRTDQVRLVPGVTSTGYDLL